MSRPDFNATIIHDLRLRVIAHNTAPGASAVKLGGLKAVYTKAWSGLGAEPSVEAAMAKVDRYLAGLAKVDDFNESEHPRDGDGKFSNAGGGKTSAAPKAAAPAPAPPPQLAAPLPASPDDHARLMADSAGYRALQTAVIPETRYGYSGKMIRDAATLAAGIAYTAGLARGRGGMLDRGFRLAGSKAGELVGGGAGAVLSALWAGGESAALRALGRDTQARQAARWAIVRARAGKAGAAGGRAGRAVGAAAFLAQSVPVRFLAGAAEMTGRNQHMGRVRRRAAIAAMGLGPAAQFNNALTGTALDPQVIGSGIDAFQTREVQKFGDLDAHRAAMLAVLHKGGDFGDLHKAAAPFIPRLYDGRAQHLYSAAGRAILSAGAAVAGGLAGGAVGAGAGKLTGHLVGGKRGNPYHDEHGHFTSKDNARSSTGWGATIGGLLGAAAAGVGVYAAIHGHNMGVLRAVARNAARRESGVFAAINSKTGLGTVKRMVTNRTATINDTVAKKLAEHPDVLAAEAAHDAYGASSPLHYKAKVLDAINNHIAEQATFQDGFKVKAADGKWLKLGDLKAEITARRGGRDAIPQTHQAAKAFVASLDETTAEGKAAFAKAIEDLSPAQQETHRQWFLGRGAHVADVDQQLAKHHEAIKDAETTLADADAAVKKAAAEELDLKAVTDRTHATLEEKRAADDAFAAAGPVTAKATEARAAAEKALDALKTKGVRVKEPVGGTAIPRPNQVERTAALDGVRARVRKPIEARETKAYDAKIDELRAQQRRSWGERANARAAAEAILSERVGVPRGAQALRDQLAAAQRKIEETGGKIAAARRASETARAALKRIDDTLAIKRGANRPKPSDRAILQANRGRFVQDAEAAEATVSQLTPDYDAAVAARAAAAPGFRAAMLAAPAAKKSRFRKLLPDGIASALKADLDAAKGSMDAGVKNFLNRPNMKNLLAFTKAKAAEAKKAANDTRHWLFYHQTPEGPRLSWMKVMSRGPIVTGFAASSATGAKELYDYVKAHAIGTEDDKRNAKRPKMPASVHWEINPVTGAGYAAVAVPHPTEKGEQVILYGQRQDDMDSLPKQLVPGAKVSAVKTQFQHGKWNQGQQGGTGQAHTGGFENMDQADKVKANEAIQKLRAANALTTDTIDGAGGTTVAYLREGQANHGAAEPVQSAMKAAFLNRGRGSTTDRNLYYGALKALFSHHAQGLTPRQRFAMLSGKAENGNGVYDHGIFPDLPDLTSASPLTVARTLESEINRAVTAMPPTAADAANLHRAVHMIGLAKGIPANSLAPIHARIVKATPAQQNNQGQKGQGQQNGQQRQGRQNQGQQTQDKAAEPPDPVDKFEPPPDWDEEEFNQHTLRAAGAVRTHGGGAFAWKGSQRDVQSTLSSLALYGHADHGLTMTEAVSAAERTLKRRIDTAPQGDMAEHIRRGHAGAGDQEMFDEFGYQAEKIKGERANTKLDNLDDLMKAFDTAKHPRHQAGDSGGSGGEFSAGDGQASAGGNGGAGGGHGHGAGAVLSEFHPVRAVPDLAGSFGMQAAWQGVDHLITRYGLTGAKAQGYVAGKLSELHPAERAMRAAARGLAPEAVRQMMNDAGAASFGNAARAAALGIAERFLPPAAKLVVGAGGLGVKLVASGVGAAAASTAGDAAVRGGYRLAGATAPVAAEREEPFGRTASALAGSLLGGGIGASLGATGGPLGTFAGGAAGNWAGGAAGGQLYDWFAGYPADKTEKAMAHLRLPAPNVREPARLRAPKLGGFAATATS